MEIWLFVDNNVKMRLLLILINEKIVIIEVIR